VARDIATGAADACHLPCVMGMRQGPRGTSRRLFWLLGHMLKGGTYSCLVKRRLVSSVLILFTEAKLEIASMKPIIGDQIEHAEIYETVEPGVAPNSSLRLQDGKATARPDGCQYEASHRGTDSIVDIGGLPGPHGLDIELWIS